MDFVWEKTKYGEKKRAEETFFMEKFKFIYKSEYSVGMKNVTLMYF